MLEAVGYVPEENLVGRAELLFFSLDEGTERPALSLYLNVSAADFKVLGRHTKIERVRVAANLRHAHHDTNLEGVMCRGLVSVDWRGFVYDCDFNQMLGLPVAAVSGERIHLRDLMGLDWEGRAIPDVLSSGNHAAIERWRHEQARARTAARRPDLLGPTGGPA